MDTKPALQTEKQKNKIKSLKESWDIFIRTQEIIKLHQQISK